MAVHRTLRTFRLPRRTDQRAEFHHRLIESPCALAVLRGESRGQLPQFRIWHSDFRIPKDSSQHSTNVRIDCRHRFLIREACHRACRVPSDTRQLLQLVGVIRKSAVVCLADHARQRVKISRSRVVAEALPLFHDRFGAGAGQLVDRGESGHEARVVLEHSTDLRLLQHEFRDEDGIGVASVPPR